jgi:hypothetical protein
MTMKLLFEKARGSACPSRQGMLLSAGPKFAVSDVRGDSSLAMGVKRLAKIFSGTNGLHCELETHTRAQKTCQAEKSF